MINDDDDDDVKEQQHFCHLQRHCRELIIRRDDNHHYDDAELEPKGKEHFVIHEGLSVDIPHAPAFTCYFFRDCR
jgi:hypothetical protein